MMAKKSGRFFDLSAYDEIGNEEEIDTKTSSELSPCSTSVVPDDPVADKIDDRSEDVVPLIAAKPAKGDRHRQKIPLRTNVFRLKLPEETVLYRYNVSVIAQEKDSQFSKELTKGSNDDHRREEKRRDCYEYFLMMMDNNKDIFKNPFATIYDRQKIFYSLEKLPFSDKRSFSVYEGVKITLEANGVLKIGNFESEVKQNLDLRQRDQQQALEIATSQVFYYQEKYVQLGRSVLDTTGHEEKENNVGGGKYLASGFSKGVRIVEGEGKEPIAAVQLDQKKAALFKPQPVIMTIMEILNFQKAASLIPGLKKEDIKLLDQQLRGVVVATYYTDEEIKRGCKPRKFEIQGMTSKKAMEIEVDVMDKKRGISRTMSVVNYFKEMKGIILDFPELQCFIEKTSRGTNFYPLEKLRICENQRVPMHKQTPEQMQNAIKKCALKPSDRLEQLQSRTHDSGVKDSKFLRELGIRMISKGMEVEGRVLPQPTIKFAGDRKVPINQDGNWDMKGNNPWFKSGAVQHKKWKFICTDIRITGPSLMSFMDKFIQFAEKTGIVLGGPPDTENCEVRFLEQLFKRAAAEKYNYFLLVLDNKKDNAVKDFIKMLEQRYEILTQCVRSQIIEEIGNPKDRNKNPMGILMNILAKANMKLGGQNFNFQGDGTDKLIRKWFSGGVLYLGVDVNHPPPQTGEERRQGLPPKEPSVVGMVGCGADPGAEFRYTGEHWYQDPRVETVTAMRELTLEFLQRYAKSATKVDPLPKSVILFRDGVSEGQYKMLLTEEIPAIRKAFHDFKENFHPKLTVIVVLKRHTLRLMNIRQDSKLKASQQDIPVGTVVDHTIVHPTNWEFYLQSHRAIQGTAKCCKYCVVYDENGLTQNEVEEISYMLAHSHQIVSKTVSLPAPVYGGHEMAERGKRIFRAENAASEASSSGTTTETPDWDAFSRKHRIGGTKFEDRKHWA